MEFKARNEPSTVASGRGKYCSKSCANKGINNPMYGNHHSGNALTKISKRSREIWNDPILRERMLPKHDENWLKKIRLSNSGENNHLWDGGPKTFKLEIRRSPQYVDWRKSIFVRDDYTCQMCGVRGVELHDDHYPKTFAQILKENNIQSLEDATDCDELWDTNNNRALCIDCHKSTPSYLNSHYLRRELVWNWI